MDAKKLYKKHLELHIPKGVYMSEKQMEQARYEATIDAINEALSIVPVQEIDEDNSLDYFDSKWFPWKKELIGEMFECFTFIEEDMVGSVYLEASNLSIYCSPFWEYVTSDEMPPEDKMGIDIFVTDIDGKVIKQNLIQYPYPTNENEFDAFKVFYLELLKKLAKEYK